MVDDEMHMSMIKLKLVELRVKYMLNPAIVGKKERKKMFTWKKAVSLDIKVVALN